MKIALVTFYDDAHREMGQLTLPNKQEYCDRHGYTLIAHTKACSAPRAQGWSKDIFIRAALPFYDAVFWVDADALIVDMERPVETLLDTALDIVFGGDHINNGVFIIRNTEAMFEFLQLAWDLPNVDPEFASLAAPNSPKWSQLCMVRILKIHPGRFRYSNAGSTFSAPYFQPGYVFVLHPYGSPINRRMEYIAERMDNSQSFGAQGLDKDIARRFGNRFGTFLEFCEGSGQSGIARKLARTGWCGDLIGVDIAQSDLLLNAYWGFNSIRTHGCVQSGRYDVVSVMREVSREEIAIPLTDASLLLVPRTMQELAVGLGFLPKWDSDDYVVCAR